MSATPRRHPRRARLRAPIAATFATGAALAGAWVPAQAAEPRPDQTVVNTYRVDYKLASVWSHDQGFQNANSHDTFGYELGGTLGNVRFSDKTMIDNASVVLKQTPAEGGVSLKFTNPEGTSVSCVSEKLTVSGAFGIGRGAKGLWVAPWVTPHAAGTCNDSDGGVSPLDFSAPVSTAAQTQTSGSTPPGAAAIIPSFDEIESGGFSKDFKVVYADGPDCPGYNPDASINCSLELRGTLTFTRVSRKVEEDLMYDLLGPTKVKKKPALNPKKNKAETRVRCSSRCDIEALIGVFGGTKERPRVIKLQSVKRRGQAGRTTKLSVSLNAPARAAVASGRAVMQLKVKVAGKRRDGVYPLS